MYLKNFLITPEVRSFPEIMMTDNTFSMNFNKLTGRNSTPNFTHIDFRICGKTSSVSLAFPDTCDTEWRSSLFKLESHCRIVWHLSSHQVYKKPARKCLNASLRSSCFVLFLLSCCCFLRTPSTHGHLCSMLIRWDKQEYASSDLSPTAPHIWSYQLTSLWDNWYRSFCFLAPLWLWIKVSVTYNSIKSQNSVASITISGITLSPPAVHNRSHSQHQLSRTRISFRTPTLLTIHPKSDKAKLFTVQTMWKATENTLHYVPLQLFITE